MIEIDEETRRRVLERLERMKESRKRLDELAALSDRLREEGEILRRARDIMIRNAARRAAQ